MLRVKTKILPVFLSVLIMLLCIFEGLIPVTNVMAATPNLVVNSSFDGADGWNFINGGVSGGHFYLDSNARVSQIITIPTTGTYKIEGYMATSGGEVDCTFGVKYKDGDTLNEITLESGLNYELKTLGQFDLQANDQIEVYCTRGSTGDWINGDDISVTDVNYVAPPDKPNYRGNLLKNPGFEDGLEKWTFENSSNNYHSGSGIQNNNPHSGNKGFFLDGGSEHAVRQTITVPFSGFYKTSAYISTGGGNSKFGLKYSNGDTIKEITIPNGAGYSTSQVLKEVELMKGDTVEIYCLGGDSWTNGDDFQFEYDISQTQYNLLTGSDFPENAASAAIFVPRDGDYAFTAEITAIDSTTGAAITFDGQSELVQPGETKEIHLISKGKTCGDEITLSIAGNCSVNEPKIFFDTSNIPNTKPEAQDVQIEGQATSGTTLIGSYSYFDADVGQEEGTPKFHWLSSDSQDGIYTPIEGEDTKSLTLSDDMENKYIKFEVTPMDTYGLKGEQARSEAIGPIKINLIRNSSFDIESGISGWSVKNGGSVTNNSGLAHTGFRYASIPARAPLAEVFYPVKIEKTSYYNAGAWVKTSTAGGELGIRIKGRSVPIASVQIPQSDTYQFVSIPKFVLEKGSNVEIYIKGTEECSNINADDFQLIQDNTEEIPTLSNLLSFTVEGEVDSKINDEDKTIQVTVPYKTDITKLKVAAELSEGASMTPASGSVVDFGSPVEFTIANGNVLNIWTVTCIVKEKTVTLKSDNAMLQDTFNWAVNKTGQYVMTGKSGYVNKTEGDPIGNGTADYIPSYWAGYYDRSAFYSRDFVHQSVAAELVGLQNENYSMFYTFAENATEARKWYTPWSFNFDGTPLTIDYNYDDFFVREVPAQFELVEKAYKQYLWTGDEKYIKDPVMWNFYTRVMTDFITLHDSNHNGIAEGTARGIYQGACSYNERGDEPIIESGDAIGSQYQATLAYAAMLAARGENEASQQWYDNADQLKKYFNGDWSVYNGDGSGRYARAVTADGRKYNDFGKENSWFMPMKLITEPGSRNDAYLDYISENVANGIGTGPQAPANIEAYTYLPDTFFPYNRNEDAWKWMKYVIGQKDNPHEHASQGTNGDYPEISFTLVSQTIEGLMGVTADAPQDKVSTLSHLPQEIGWVQANYINMGDHLLNIRQDGLKKTTMENVSDHALSWEAQFTGVYPSVNVSGALKTAQTKTINGLTVSYVTVDVPAGQTVTAEATSRTIGSGNGSSNIPEPPAKVPEQNNGPVKIKAPKPSLDATGTATTVIDTETFQKAVGASKAISIEVPIVEGANVYETTIPAEAVTAGEKSRIVEIITEIGSITIPSNMLSKGETANVQNVVLSIAKADAGYLDGTVQDEIGNRPVIEISLKIGGSTRAWSNPEAPVTISIPYTPSAEELTDPEHIVVWYIDSKDRIKAVPTGKYDADTGTVTFTTTYFSRYAVAFVKKTFSDIDDYAWARKAIEVMASKGVINGTTADTYTPSAAVKRADFMLLLVKALGLSTGTEGNFSDVSPTAYYAEAVATAKKLGITTGVGNNRFNPEAQISRQDMMVFINKAMIVAKKNLAAGTTADLNAFTDRTSITSYAEQSVATLVKNGIVSGSGANINPLGNVTRAETAVLIYKVYNK